MRRILLSLIFLVIIKTLGVGLAPSMGTAAQQCDGWVLRIESVQGTVEARKPGDAKWLPVELNDTFCSGSVIRVGERSRAAVSLRTQSVLRLDENTTVSFSIQEQRGVSILDFLTGAVYFFGRTPRSLEVNTPYVNALMEGTEFFARVERNRTLISTFEGQVTASNNAGSLTMGAGQSIIAQAGLAPVRREVAVPRDAVHWALYYPLVLDLKPADFADTESDWQQRVRKSIAFYWKNDLPEAFSSLADITEDIDDPRFFIYRATLLLTVGRVDAARADLKKALKLEPGNGHATAIQSVIAVSQGNKDEALRLAGKAVELEPASPAPRVALSYAQQANFDVKSALESLKDAAKLDPGNALVWARLSEMQLSVGDLDRSLESAEEAVHLNPNLSRTQTVLGFAYLTQIKTEESKEAFKNAIKLDQADALPRLGLGLAKIREGDLEEGRRELEIAVSLDPNNSLIRSYLGKAYFEEKRDKLASDQFALAKELDPRDPTPWFYDAIEKQTVNRPVEALEDIQKSIALNDNRAVYRSRLLLDQDLAARSVSLARIYDDLGFQWLALNEGWKSLNTDPANFSAHRFLSDSYFSLPRHEIARVSELLQSQLLQPLNIMPIQPQLAETKLFLLSSAGPRDPSYNEYTPLFTRNQLALLLDGVGGERSTFAEDVVQSGLWERFSYSLGQFHSETDGFRPNNYQRSNIYNAFTQVSLSPKTNLQFEYRNTDFHSGNLFAFFDPESFDLDTKQQVDTEIFRLGGRHSFTPNSDVIGSLMYGTLDGNQAFRLAGPENIPFDYKDDESAYGVEAQYLYRSERLNITTGAGHFYRSSDFTFTFFPDEPFQFTSLGEDNTPHTNFYIYSYLNYPNSVTWTLGVSADFLGGDLETQQANPKFGITWSPFPGTTLRGAVFEALKRTLITQQTIEPTQVAGFNQFYDDGNGADAWRYGIGLDQKLTDHLFAGVEYSWRDLSIPVIQGEESEETIEMDAKEKLGRAYLYWTPHPWFALGPEYQYEQYKYPEDFPYFSINWVDTQRLALGIGFYHPSGFLARLKPTFVIQDGKFLTHEGVLESGHSEFFVMDASVGYRLPRRWGLIEVEARNLFDESFRFQDTDPTNPQITPGRFAVVRWTLSF